MIRKARFEYLTERNNIYSQYENMKAILDAGLECPEYKEISPVSYDVADALIAQAYNRSFAHALQKESKNINNKDLWGEVITK